MLIWRAPPQLSLTRIFFFLWSHSVGGRSDAGDTHVQKSMANLFPPPSSFLVSATVIFPGETYLMDWHHPFFLVQTFCFLTKLLFGPLCQRPPGSHPHPLSFDTNTIGDIYFCCSCFIINSSTTSKLCACLSYLLSCWSSGSSARVCVCE